MRPALEALINRGRARWPQLEADAAKLQAALAPRAEEELSGPHAEDLYLAAACASGVPGAIEAFEQQYLGAGPLTAALKRIERAPSFLDEVRQAVREKLFVPAPGRIAEYSGRGALLAWTRVVAMRTALDLRPRNAAAEQGTETERAAERDPELRYLQQKYGKQFEEAVASSFARLDDEQSNLLKLQIVDGLGTAQLAALFRVDRSTIKRRLADCRQTMLAHTRANLREKLGISPASFESLARLLASQLHLSVARLLKERS